MGAARRSDVRLGRCGAPWSAESRSAAPHEHRRGQARRCARIAPEPSPRSRGWRSAGCSHASDPSDRGRRCAVAAANRRRARRLVRYKRSSPSKSAARSCSLSIRVSRRARAWPLPFVRKRQRASASTTAAPAPASLANPSVSPRGPSRWRPTSTTTFPIAQAKAGDTHANGAGACVEQLRRARPAAARHQPAQISPASARRAQPGGSPDDCFGVGRKGSSHAPRQPVERRRSVIGHGPAYHQACPVTVTGDGSVLWPTGVFTGFTRGFGWNPGRRAVGCARRTVRPKLKGTGVQAFATLCPRLRMQLTTARYSRGWFTR